MVMGQELLRAMPLTRVGRVFGMHPGTYAGAQGVLPRGPDDGVFSIFHSRLEGYSYMSLLESHCFSRNILNSSVLSQPAL